MINTFIKKYEKDCGFVEAYEGVVNWNRVAGNLHNPNQYKLIEEEYKEVIGAESNEEFVKELADLFIVSSQQFYNHFESDDGEFTELTNLTIKECISRIGDILSNGRDYWIVFPLVKTILSKCTFDVKGVLGEVINSNWTKFPSFDYFDQNVDLVTEECIRIEAQGRYKGVVADMVDFEDEQLIVFRDKNGKLLKPSSFVEPNITKYL